MAQHLKRTEPSPDYLKGMLEMAKQMLRLPEELISDENKKELKQSSGKDFNVFYENIFTESLNEEKD